MIRASLALLFGAVAMVAAVPAHSAEKGAAEKISVGVIGGMNAFTWPASIADAKGLYAKHGVAPEIIFMPSSPGMLQQLAAGSLDIAASAGLVDPIRLVARKAGIAIGRVSLRVSPYEVVAKPDLHSIADLKGKKVGIGSRDNITYALIIDMLAPFKLKPDDVELMYSGSTVARYAALKTGAYDATMLALPLSFTAESDGFRSLGVAGDYSKDMPFTGSVVNRAWAGAHLEAAKNFFAAEDEATDWFYDDAHRAEAIEILVKASKSSPDEAARSYDFLHDGNYFDRTHLLSRRGVAALVNALHELGDKDVEVSAKDAVIPGLTAVGD
jgi:NitT/TauT family transport system substrate-binding protein